MDAKDQTQPKVVGSSHAALPSSNDDTSHPSISEPQPTVSLQDVSIPAPYSTQDGVVGSSHAALPSSNDDTSHPSISEPQPTVSSQDVSVPAPNSTQPKVVGSSPVALTSSNDDTSNPSISEPQPTVSSQDVSIPAPNSTQVNYNLHSLDVNSVMFVWANVNMLQFPQHSEHQPPINPNEAFNLPPFTIVDDQACGMYVA
ncbi:uncharacterized protein LOC104265682 [Ciona intestinalis]